MLAVGSDNPLVREARRGVEPSHSDDSQRPDQERPWMCQPAPVSSGSEIHPQPPGGKRFPLSKPPCREHPLQTAWKLGSYGARTDNSLAKKRSTMSNLEKPEYLCS